MCSTPRPKKIVRGKSISKGSVLSSMNSDARMRFAERANLADEKRHKLNLKMKQINVQKNNAQKHRSFKIFTKNESVKKGLSYWLGTASIKEVFLVLFAGKIKNA